jgi:hypothetical protein
LLLQPRQVQVAVAQHRRHCNERDLAGVAWVVRFALAQQQRCDRVRLCWRLQDRARAREGLRVRASLRAARLLDRRTKISSGSPCSAALRRIKTRIRHMHRSDHAPARSPAAWRYCPPAG